MSAQYSVNIKSQYYDPNTHVNNKMSEFRLDRDSVFLPNLRLQFGFFTDAATGVNKILGYEACIKHIRLMDGGVELDSLRFANRYLSFYNQTGDNQKQLCIDSPLNNSSVGYLLNSGDKVDYITADSQTAISESEVQCALLDLRKVFPLLNSIDHLDTSIFKQLKIQIEYENNSTNLGLADKSKIATINRPVLIADVVVNEQVSAKMRSSAQKNVIWDVIEHDQMTIADHVTVTDALTGAASATQSTSAVINGFDNKYVGKMVVMKCYADPLVGYSTNAIKGYGPYNSPLYPEESLNIRKNGQFIFSGADGIKNNGLRNQMLWQTWGNVNVVPFGCQNSVGMEDFDAAAQNTSGVPTLTATKQSDRVGQASFYGFTVEDRCNQLQFTFTRNGYKDTQENNPYNAGADLHIFGECRKQMVFSSNKYNISYM